MDGEDVLAIIIIIAIGNMVAMGWYAILYCSSCQ